MATNNVIDNALQLYIMFEQQPQVPRITQRGNLPRRAVPTVTVNTNYYIRVFPILVLKLGEFI